MEQTTPWVLDRPEVLRVLFYPRPDYCLGSLAAACRVVTVPMEPGVQVAGRLYPAAPGDPLILYFHGNGETAADYDDLAYSYTEIGISLLVMDYRGYGTSGGSPSASNLLADAVRVYQNVARLCAENGLRPGRVYVMGRSLGSAAAAEVALRAGPELSGLIIESGFADTFALLARLGSRPRDVQEEPDGFRNAAKLARIGTRTLIIHGEQDALIPVADGRQLYMRSAAAEKHLVLIPGAGHNNLMIVGMRRYFQAIGAFVCGET